MTPDELFQLIAANAQTAQAALQLAQANTVAIADLRASIADLRANQADVLEALRLQGQLIFEEQNRRAEMQQNATLNDRRYLELREDMQMMQSEVRGLQIQANRILDRLEERDR